MTYHLSLGVRDGTSMNYKVSLSFQDVIVKDFFKLEIKTTRKLLKNDTIFIYIFNGKIGKTYTLSRRN